METGALLWVERLFFTVEFENFGIETVFSKVARAIALIGLRLPRFGVYYIRKHSKFRAKKLRFIRGGRLWKRL